MTYGVTWGEGDGPADGGGGLVSIKSSLTDVISNVDTETFFANLIDIGVDIAEMAVGDAIRLTARGLYSTFGSAGALTFNVYNAGDLLLTTGAQTLAANASDRGWWLDAMMINLSSGSNNQGHFAFSTTGRLWEAMDMENAGDSAVSLGSGYLNISVLWGTADPANSITMRQLVARRIING